jgi:GMP reductase
MRIEDDRKLDYRDVLIRPKRSTLGSRKEVDLYRDFSFRNHQSDQSQHYRGIPIMASNMDGVGTFDMADTLAGMDLFTCLVKSLEVDELVGFFNQDDPRRRDNVACSTGITEHDFDKFSRIYQQTGTRLKYLCVDVANGYSERFSEFIKKLRDAYPEIILIAGNVVTGEMTEELILGGADIVKVGIGPGSVCTTRIQTGVGFPQLSAVIECADSAHGLGGHIIADGGCTCAGDVAKAFAAGADFVMLGGMFAGHDQGGGEVITRHYRSGEVVDQGNGWEDVIEQRHYVSFYGMSSRAANEKHFGGLKEYRSSEGREIQVPYRGNVETTVRDILGGIRSTCTYAGAKKLKWLSKCATFVKAGEQYNRIFADQ